MRRNTFHAGSFFTGLLIGIVFLVVVLFAYYYGRNGAPAAQAAATSTPQVQGTQPGIPLTGVDDDTGNPVRTGLRSLLQEINQQIITPLVAWFKRSVRINMNGQSTPVLVIPTAVIATPTP